MSIREEIQGPSGYLKLVRSEYMPDTKTMARLAYEAYCNKEKINMTADYVRNNADEILKGLFLAETEIFKEKNNEIMYRLLPYFYRIIYDKKDGKYVETKKKMDQLLHVYELCKSNNCSPSEFIEQISEIMVPIIDVVSFSQKQSAKCRVGETLQNHLATLFNVCGVKYETQQQKVDGGTVMDFVVPSLKAIEQMPDQVINIECQTTLKDRFRLTTGKSTDAKIKRYLATITGAGIVTSKDIHDFSVEKIKEIILDNNVTLVVLKEVKDAIADMLKKFRDVHESGKRQANAAITGEEIDKLLVLSEKKIISYSELIARDIHSTLIYWQ